MVSVTGVLSLALLGVIQWVESPLRFDGWCQWIIESSLRFDGLVSLGSQTHRGRGTPFASNGVPRPIHTNPLKRRAFVVHFNFVGFDGTPLPRSKRSDPPPPPPLI
jgi:hypothetical protein